jgi:WD40 repeat protein
MSSARLDRQSALARRDGDPDALIEEARRRTRRRRRRDGLFVAAVIVAGVLAVLLADRSGGGRGVVAESRSTPFANLRAFSGQGELAFVSRDVVWVLDGESGTLRRLPVPAGWTPSSPELSHDGRWLAYLTAASTTSFPTTVELWLAQGDGTGAHVVTRLDVSDLVGWSPSTDVLAVIGGSRRSTLELIRPGGRTRVLVALTGAAARHGSVWNAAWSPNGREIAASIYGGAVDGTTIRAYPVAGGTPTTWFHIRFDQSFPVHICSGCGGGSEVIADLVGWWPRWGIGFWVYCCGATHNNDGSPLALIGRPGARPRVLTRTLSSGVTDAVAAGANGELAVVAENTNAGREIGIGKAVETCDARTRSCVAVPSATTWIGPDRQRCAIPSRSAQKCLGFAIPAAGKPGSGVSLDPAWSPGGGLLAYVRAPIALTDGWPDAAWYADHALYVWNTQTDATRRIATVDGANVPTWSASGRNLLYVRNNGLWLAPANRGSPSEIAYPLFPPTSLYTSFANDYYGQIPWTAQFSWWSA